MYRLCRGQGSSNIAIARRHEQSTLTPRWRDLAADMHYIPERDRTFAPLPGHLPPIRVRDQSNPSRGVVERGGATPRKYF